MATPRALPEGAIYIGRGAKGLNLPPSKWGNPFRTRPSSVAVEQYARWLPHQPHLRESLGELTGKVLVCHCKPGTPCHADVLIKYWHTVNRQSEVDGDPAEPEPGSGQVLPPPKRGRPTGGPGRQHQPRWLQQGGLVTLLNDIRDTTCPQLWRDLWPNTPTEQPPMDMPQRFILHMYAGQEGPEALGQVMMHEAPQMASILLELDERRSPKHDILEGSLYSHLLDRARCGQIIAIVANIPGPGPEGKEQGPQSPRLSAITRLLTIAAYANSKCKCFIFISCPVATESDDEVWGHPLIGRLVAHLGLTPFKYWQCSVGGGHTPPATAITTSLPCRQQLTKDKCPHTFSLLTNDYNHKWTQHMQRAICSWLSSWLSEAPPDTKRLPADSERLLSAGHKVHSTEPGLATDPTTLTRHPADSRVKDRGKAGIPPPPAQTRELSRTTPHDNGPAEGRSSAAGAHREGSRREAGIPPPQSPSGTQQAPPGPALHDPGPPLITREDHRLRGFRDGGGLASPGTRMMGERREARLAPMAADLRRLVQSRDLRRRVDQAYIQKQDSPFTPEDLLAARRIIQEHSSPEGASRDTVAQGQPFLLDLMQDAARLAGDPDWQFPGSVADGVPLGVEEKLEMPHAIWPPKLVDDPEPEETPSCADNYDSAEDHADLIKATYREEKDLQMTLGPFKDKESAAQACGTTPDSLCTGALGAKDEKDKVRTVHDGTVNGVNKWIQMNIPGKTTAPRVADLLLAARSLEAQNIPFAMLKTDVKKAHRRIKVQKKDWKYTAAKIGDEFWINTCGTYGVASAQWYWGRMAALILRLTYALDDGTTWHFVYVDDFVFLIQLHNGSPANDRDAVILLFLSALGVPLAWKKTHFSSLNTWVGFLFHCERFTVQIAHPKLPMLVGLLDRVIANERHRQKEVESLVGLLNWATGAYRASRALLYYFYRWLHRMQGSSHPPRKAVTIARLIRELITRPAQ